MDQDQIIFNYAMQFVGLPYLWGGDDPMSGFDCSGLVCELLQAAGKIPHNADFTAQSLYNKFSHKKTIEPSHGSLVFFGVNVGSITHVGYCLSYKLMLEAGGGGSKTTNLEQAVKSNAYIRVRPIMSRNDLVCFVNP